MPNAKQIALDFENIVKAMDQPLADTAFISNYYLSKFSSKTSKLFSLAMEVMNYLEAMRHIKLIILKY